MNKERTLPEGNATGIVRAEGPREVHIPAALTLVLGLIASALLCGWAWQGTQKEAGLDFDRRAERLVAEIQRRVQLTGYGLMGARDLYMGSEFVSRVEFHEYVLSRDLAGEFPGAVGFGLVQRVLHNDLADYMAAERADAAPSYAVVNPGSGPDHYVVKYIEPVESNRAEWGLDLGAYPVRRAALEKAVRSGAHTLSAPFDIDRDATAWRGFLYLVPLYEKGDVAETPEARMAKLVGVLYAPMVMDEVLRDIASQTEDMLQFDIQVEGDADQPVDLFRFDRHRNAITGLLPEAKDSGGRFKKEDVIQIANQVWDVDIRSTTLFESEVDRALPIVVGGGGALLSFLLAAVIWLRGHSRAQSHTLHIAQERADARAVADATHREQLEVTLAARTQELGQIQAELIEQERMAVLGRLIATVSHELRNPLGTIQASLYSISTRLASGQNDVSRPLERAERNIRRCDRIIEELLDYTRKRPLELANTHMGTWLNEIQAEFPFPEIVSVVTNFESAVKLEIDPNLYRRCIINVWQNACDAMLTPEGEHYAADQACLEVTSAVAMDRFEIRTRDNGRGMNDVQQEKILEPLFTTKTFGTGLGLSIVSEIVAAHNGGIDVESALDEGTTITLWIPMPTAP